MISHHSRSNVPKCIEDRSSRTGHVKRYKVRHHLGKGGFANVYRVQSADSAKIYACKIINKSKLVSSEHQRKLVSEIQLHRDLRHPNIVRFERQFEDKKNVYILLECCSNGSLMELSMRRTRLTEPEVRYFMKEILVAIQFLHSRFIIHRDLKLGNILLDQNMTIKICDFGLAAKLQFDSERKTTICGTPNYTAPEILNQRKSGEGHSYEVDVWAIGVIMFTLLTGKPPFETKNIKETYRRIKRIKYQWPPNSDQYISPQAKSLISGVFKKAATERPNLEQMAGHPFFTELPVPKALPPSILKRVPAMKDLFEDAYSPQSSADDARYGLSSSSSSSSAALQNKKERQPLRSADYNQRRERVSSFPPHKNQGGDQREAAPPRKALRRGTADNDSEDPLENECGARQPLQSESARVVAADSADRRGAPVRPQGDGGQGRQTVSVLKFVDYTKKYGLGYVLTSGATGIYFNDSTKMVLHRNRHNVVYVDGDGAAQQCSLENFPQCLRKKVTLLRHFADYLWRAEDGESDEVRARNLELEALAARAEGAARRDIGSLKEEDTVYLARTVSDQYCVLFKLSNNTVQVNFTDSSRIIIRGSVVEYRNKRGATDTHRLTALFASNQKDLKKRCKYTQQLLHRIATEERL